MIWNYLTPPLVRKKRRLALLLLSLWLALNATAADLPPPLSILIERIIARDEANQQALKSMQYHESLRTEQIDEQGRVQRSQEAVMLIRPGASPEVQVLSTHGDDLPTDPDEAARQAKGKEEQRKQMKIALRDLAARFLITLSGSDVLNGQPVYIISFEPRPAQPYNNQTEHILNFLHGKMWISTRDYTVLQTEATLAQPVAVAWIFATISRLDFHYELHGVPGDLGPALVKTFVKVDAPFFTIRQRMTVEMNQFEPRPRGN